MLRQFFVGVDYTHGVNQVSALKCRHSNVFRSENICIPTFSNPLTKCGTSQCDFDLFSPKGSNSRRNNGSVPQTAVSLIINPPNPL